MKLAPLAIVAVIAAATPASPLAAASPAGFAYDSVMKFQAGSGDPSTIQPGTFDADYAAASQVPKSSGSGGMFGLGKMLGSAQAAMSMFKTGTATRHYIGGSKERIDTPALQTATITDCAARTITTLDLAKKTYTVVSMDQPYKSGSSGGSGKPGPAPTDDGTKVAIAFTTTSLGPKTVEAVPTSGYDADMKMTMTKADGESSTADTTLVAYYTAMGEPGTVCPHAPLPGSGASSGAPSAAMMAQYAIAMQALKSKGDSRFTVTQSGPPLPAGKFSMFNVFAVKSDRGQGSFDVIDERGNARPISPDDPIFSVPPDFTKVGS